MSGVDDRVVQLKFDNKQFEAASAQSMSTLDKLKKSLDFSGSQKSLSGFQKTAAGFNLGNIGTTIEGISTKFLMMGTIGVTALVQITQQALATGQQMAKALTIDPVKSGFAEYSTNLQSIQTILANTQDQGTNLKQVNAALKELNDYSDKTIYNFSEMARNIGTFTAAGVDLKTSTEAIKGIANLAALSGSNAQQAATAMYQLSQAIASGTVKLMDWNSVQNAGMGGAAFQTALTKTAIKMGALNANLVKFDKYGRVATIAGNKFRDSLSQGKAADWLTSGVLTKTLGHLTGDLTDAQLAAEGFTKAEIKSIQATAKAASDAATQVKTIQQAFEVAKETAGSGWAQTWQLIFGDFAYAKKDMTALSKFMNGIINDNAKRRNDLLIGWKATGGQVEAVRALKFAMEALGSVITPIKKAWAEVFPPTTSAQLMDITRAVRDFFRGLILSEESMDRLRVTFKGIFSVIDIGKKILSGMFGFLKDIFGLLFQGAGEAGGGILEFTSNIGLMLIKFNEFLTSTNAIPAFFDRLYNAVGPTIVKIRDFARAVGEVLGSGIGNVVTALTNMGTAATTANEEGVSPLAQTWSKLLGFFKGVPDLLNAIGEAIKGAFTGVGEGVPDITGTIMDNLKKINWVLIFKATLGAGFVAGVGLVIKGIWNAIDLFLVTPKRVMKAVEGVLNDFGDALGAFEKKFKAQALLMQAAAILALAVALKILSTIDIGKLVLSIAAIKLLFMMLNSSMDALSNIGDNKGFLKIPAVAASLILIAGAMILFALAIKLFSMMDMGEILKGFFSMSLIVGGVVGVAKLLEKAQGDILRFSAGMLLLAFAMNAFASAIFIYSRMEPETIIKGGFVVVALITALGLAMRALPKEGQMFKAAAGLLVMAIAINMLVIPIKILGGMEFGDIVKGIFAIGAVLLVMAVALNAMKGALPGAAAMIIASAALLIFAKSMEVLSAVGFGSVILGILGIVIAMAAIAGAAFLLAPAAIPMAIFGAALLILGAGFALLGAGALAFATAMSIIISVMSLGMPILEDTIRNAIKLIPLLAQAFYTFLVEFANAFAAATPAMVNAITVFIANILISITKLIPLFQKVFSAFIKAGLDTIASFYGDFIAAGLTFINKILKGIADNLPGIIKSGTKIITTLIEGMGKAASDIAIAAGETMLDFMEAITNWINNNEERIGNAGRDLAGAIVSGFASAMTGGLANDAYQAVSGFFGNVISTARGILDSHSPSKVFIKIGKDVTDGFVIGIASGKDAVQETIKSITDEIKQAADDAAKNVKELQAKVKDLDANKPTKSNEKALAKARAELKLAEAEKKRLDAAYKTISKERKAQEAQLIALGAQYDVITEKLENARQKYADAIKERDDYNKSVTEQYSALPQLEATSTLDEYFDAIRAATQANIKFKQTLEQLRGLGLDDNQYKKFMEQGTEIQPFLDQLLAAGGGTIQELNRIDTTLTDSASQLGKSASSALYQAGVDSAKGLVDGLESQMKTITDKMKFIGKAIADELKRELGIKSPSKVTKEVGKFLVEGLAEGIDQNAKVIDISAKRLGKSAADSLKESLTGLADAVNSEVNLQPTIAPVLDLDAFRKDASGISDILTPKMITPSTSTTVANDISNRTAANALAMQEQALASTGTTVELTQINQSPKALSTAEIYRQTKNQLSVLKGALDN